jgi:salicylate hydroxylase
MDHDVDVAVVGGGLGGLTLAIGLLREGVPVEVFEQAGDLREVGAGVALGANSIRLLGRLGVGAASAGNVPPDVQFRRWDDGTLIWSHPVGDWYRERMGGPFVLLHRGTLRRLLAEAVPSERVHTGHRLVGIDQRSGGVRLRFAGRADVLARIAVGVDGIHSAVRSHVGGNVAPVLSGEIGFRGLIPVKRCPDMPAPRSIQLWCGPRTHAVAYGIDDGALINLLAVYQPERLPVWTRTTHRTAGSSAEALGLFRGLGWDSRILGLIDCIGGEMHFWALQDLPPVAHWSRGRVVLAGDAVHAPLPHQGQGAGQAIEDAYMLAGLLARAGPAGHTDAFVTYERLRRGRARRVQHYSRQAGRFYKLDGAAAARRDAALPGLPERIAWIHAHDVEVPTAH